MLNKAPNVFNYFAQRSVSCIKTELEPGTYIYVAHMLLATNKMFKVKVTY